MHRKGLIVPERRACRQAAVTGVAPLWRSGFRLDLKPVEVAQGQSAALPSFASTLTAMAPIASDPSRQLPRPAKTNGLVVLRSQNVGKLTKQLFLVEKRRIELPTFALRTRRSPS